MNAYHRLFVLGLMALLPLFARAQLVTIETDFNWIPGSPRLYGDHLKLTFKLPDQRTGFNFSAGLDNFIFYGLSEWVVTNGGVAKSLSGWAGWYDYGASKGIDVRMTNILLPGDSLQLVVNSPLNLFSGAPSDPTISDLHLKGLSSWMEYYAPDYTWRAFIPAYNATYDVIAVPEPSTYVVFGAAFCLALVTIRRWRVKNI
jgi:hypothetical protein